MKPLTYRKKDGVLPGAEAISCNQGDTGLLFFHGFTGSPYEGSLFAEHFSKLGYGLSVPLLPGHGTQPEDLLSIPYEKWLEAAESAYHEMTSQYGKVIVCGQSMGGALALHVASKFPVDGLITMAAAVFLKDWRLRFLPVARRLITYQYKSKGPDIRDKESKAASVSYPKYPLSSLDEFLKLIEQVKNKLPKVTSPALLVHSNRDHTITVENVHYIYSQIKSERKDLLVLDDSYHVISVDVDRARIFSECERFIQSILHSDNSGS
ncbi:MAG: alpha/beta fold hydrolase [Calditrichota bacterium]